MVAHADSPSGTSHGLGLTTSSCTLSTACLVSMFFTLHSTAHEQPHAPVMPDPDITLHPAHNNHPAGEFVPTATPLETVEYLQQLTAQLNAGDAAALSFVQDKLVPCYIEAAARAAAASTPPVQQFEVCVTPLTHAFACATAAAAALLMCHVLSTQIVPLAVYVRRQCSPVC